MLDKLPSSTNTLEESDPVLQSSSLCWFDPARIVLAMFFLAVIGFSRPANIGSDAFWYVTDIRNTMDHPWTDSPAIWEFAHLLWRPLGRILGAGLSFLARPFVGGDARAEVTLLMISVSVIAAFICCFLVQSAIWRLTGKPWLATLIAGAFLGFNPLLNDSRTAAPYVVGLTFSMAALHLTIFSTSASRYKAAVSAGILSAVATSFWVPLIVSFPAVLLARPILRRAKGSKLDFRFLATMVLAWGTTLAVLYGLVMFAAHITSFSGFRAWMIRGAAGVSGVRDRTLVRMATGMVRGFYNLGEDSVWFKWYVFHDPYAHVSLFELFRVSLARIALFYSALAGLIVLLWSSWFGKRLLLLVLLLAAPHIAMALAFESASPERYIGPLGLVAIAFGYIAGNPQFGRAKRALAVALCCAPFFFNVAEVDAKLADAKIQHDVDRITPFLHVPEATRIFVLSLRDSLLELRYAAPFHPIQRETLPRIDFIQPLSHSDWRTAFACAAIAAWQGGGQVWITERVLRDTPARKWLWVEGDNTSISWDSVHRFFTSFSRGETLGGEDGFFQLEDSVQNRSVLIGQDSGALNCSTSAAAPATGR